jgi:hypothetical protein
MKGWLRVAIWSAVAVAVGVALWRWKAAIVANADTAQSLATAAGILIGGGWALYRFAIQRSRETALALDLTTTSVQHHGDTWLVFFDVAFRNAGSVLIAASRERPAYNDDRQRQQHTPGEVVQYGVDLKLRKMAEALPEYEFVSWWSNAKAGQWDTRITEVDLAEDYEDPSTERTDFWIEPGETAHVSAALVLPAGHFVAKVTFIGVNTRKDFWSRSFLVTVPAAHISS